MKVETYLRRENGELFETGSVDILDVTTCKGANKGPSTMGYKFVLGIRGSKIHEFLFDKRIRKEHLQLLQNFDVVIAPWGLVPNHVVVEGVVADKKVKHGIIGAGVNTSLWMKALS